MRRVYSELVPLPELVDAPALDALAERAIELLAAVRPGEERIAAELVASARARGLRVGLWPMLDDADGRWLNPDNERQFEAWVDALVDAAPDIDTLVMDLEPPIAEVRALVDGRLDAARAWLGRDGSTARHAHIVDRLRARGIESYAAVIPAVLHGGRVGRGWQRGLGTPIDGVAYDRVSPMLYTSLFEGYGFGVVHRAAARDLLRRWAALARERFGARASVSLGAVGIGALGDEQTLRDPAELAEDVAVVRAAGIDDLALFDLSGVLARPPIEPWLDAFVGDGAGVPPRVTRRGAAIDAGVRITGLALDVAAARAGGARGDPPGGSRW